ncbi:MAG: chemotaxis protein CheX [Planctomycetaceae bacterium]|nr:chemotaxis protein CheX [Planctomycetaceae bacterium]
MTITSALPVEFINPFIKALGDTLRVMVGINPVRKSPYIKENLLALYPMSGIISLSGKVVGTVVVTMTDKLALKIASEMLMCPMTEINADVMDAVGEITNMVAGNAKAKLEKYELRLGLPNVIHGTDTDILFPEESHPMTIPFETEFGDVAIEVGFSLKNL